MSIKSCAAFEFKCDFPKCKTSATVVGDEISSAIRYIGIVNSWVMTWSGTNKEFICFCFEHNQYPRFDDKFVKKFKLIGVEKNYETGEKIKRIKIKASDFMDSKDLHKEIYAGNDIRKKKNSLI